MTYLLLGAAALAGYFWWLGRRPGGRDWRVATGAAALAVFTAAAFTGVRGQWWITVVLAVVGLWLASTVRKPAPRAAAPPPPSGMSVAEARRILGVEAGASAEEVQAAYTRLMRAVHPDKGGTAGLAAQLNAARDRLLAK